MKYTKLTALVLSAAAFGFISSAYAEQNLLSKPQQNGVAGKVMDGKPTVKSTVVQSKVKDKIEDRREDKKK